MFWALKNVSQRIEVKVFCCWCPVLESRLGWGTFTAHTLSMCSCTINSFFFFPIKTSSSLAVQHTSFHFTKNSYDLQKRSWHFRRGCIEPGIIRNPESMTAFKWGAESSWASFFYMFLHYQFHFWSSYVRNGKNPAFRTWNIIYFKVLALIIVLILMYLDQCCMHLSWPHLNFFMYCVCEKCV